MKTITVDFSGDIPEISTKYGGELGEHQSVTLNVIPEKAMTEDEDIAFYYLLFKVEGGLVSSRTYDVGEDITCAIWGQLTEQRNLCFQLIGTNGTETIIAKSPIVTLYLGNSLEGTVIGIDDNRDSLIAMIGAFNNRLNIIAEEVIEKEGDAIEISSHDTPTVSGYTVQEIYSMIHEHHKMVLYLGRPILGYIIKNVSGTNHGNFMIATDGSYNEGYPVFTFYEVTDESVSGGEYTRIGYINGQKYNKLTQEVYTQAEKAKLAGIEVGAQANVQADWDESDPTNDAFIYHKPDLSVYARKASLATVATSGNYNDLSEKPTIPSQGTITQGSTGYATGGDVYSALQNVPTTQEQSDWNEADSSAVDYIKNKPDLTIYAQSSSLASVATSGNYTDLSNKPTIPTQGSIASGNTGYATGGDVYTALQNLPSGIQHDSGGYYFEI